MSSSVRELIDIDGWTSVHYAVWEENVEKLEKLLTDENPSVNVRAETHEGCTTFYLACCKATTPLAIIKLLLNCDKDLVHFVDNNDESPLIAAVYHNRLDIVEKIIEAGADVNYKNGNGETALHFATKLGHLEIIYFLLYLTDCDATIQNDDGLNPLSVFGTEKEYDSRNIGKEMEECIKILLRFTYDTPLDVEDDFAIENYQFEEIINGLCQSILSNYLELTKIYMDAHYSALVNNKAYFIDLLNEAVDPSKRNRTFYLMALLMHEKIDSLAYFHTDDVADDIVSKIQWHDIFEIFFNMIDNETLDIFLPELMSTGILLPEDTILLSDNELREEINIRIKEPDKLKQIFQLLFQFGFDVTWILQHCFTNCIRNGLLMHYKIILDILMPLTKDFYFDDLIHDKNSIWFLSADNKNQYLKLEFLNLIQNYSSQNYYNLLLSFDLLNAEVQVQIPSLKHLCRCVIRSNIFNKRESTLIQVERLLAVDWPEPLKKYILFI